METILSALSRQEIFHIEEPSQVAHARRRAVELATLQGLDEIKTGKVAIAITEAATNLLKHAGFGDILLKPLYCGQASGVEMIAIDNGAGIGDLGLQMRDGVSTAGTYGVGLGAMRRLADEFDIYSASGKGTAVYMAFWNGVQGIFCDSWQAGVVCLPFPGEYVCGDAWVIASDPTNLTVMVADGLGHGPDAARASVEAAELIAAYPNLSPNTALWEAHIALRETRGAALAVATINTIEEQVRFAGVGNISALAIHRGERYQLTSHNGIVGNNIRKVQEFTIPWRMDSLLVLHSDGLSARWTLDSYSGLEYAHPALIASVLYRDFARERDDATIMVLRERMVR